MPPLFPTQPMSRRAVAERGILYLSAFGACVGLVEIPLVATAVTTLLCMFVGAHANVSVKFLLTTAALMTLAEALAVNVTVHTYRYAHPAAFGVPLWVPPLWAMIAVFLADVRWVVDQLDYKRRPKARDSDVPATEP